MMNSLVEKIMNVDKAVRDLYTTMLEMLNQDDMDYKIEFQDKTFDFWGPLTLEEKEEMDLQKNLVVSILLSDALERLKDTLATPEDEESNRLRNTWINIANLQRATQKIDRTSTIVSNEAYSVDEGTSKPLDYESIYIQAQRKDLSDEDKWNILLGSFVDKESLAEQSDKSE